MIFRTGETLPKKAPSLGRTKHQLYAFPRKVLGVFSVKSLTRRVIKPPETSYKDVGRLKNRSQPTFIETFLKFCLRVDGMLRRMFASGDKCVRASHTRTQPLKIGKGDGEMPPPPPKKNSIVKSRNFSKVSKFSRTKWNSAQNDGLETLC